jgi:hypothetical protein
MGRTIIVGDVHGCRVELEALLDSVEYRRADRLVFVGDLVARGPDSMGVLALVRRLGGSVVRGNHEDKLLRWRAASRAYRREDGPRPKPLGPVHAEVARAMREADWDLLVRTPLWLDLPRHGVRVVHAGVAPGRSFDQQDRRTLMRIRTVSQEGEPLEKGDGVLWGTRYTGPPHIVFGHNAARAPQLHRWATGLDTGCVYGGALTALVLAEKERIPRDPRERQRRLVSIPARRPYFHGTGGRRVA